MFDNGDLNLFDHDSFADDVPHKTFERLRKEDCIPPKRLAWQLRAVAPQPTRLPAVVATQLSPATMGGQAAMHDIGHGPT